MLTSIDDVRAAAKRVGGAVHRTPMLGASSLGAMCGADLRLKAELFQKTGSFKPRGILNRVLSLTPDERARGLVSLSAGNAAAAVAYAASIVGCRATICMPATAVASKVAATRAYGGEVVLVEGDLLEGFARTRDEAGFVVVHPFDDPDVIAGQGTVGLEIVEDAGEADVVVVPVGGGGLISGVASAVKALAPRTKVVGVEPATADVVSQSLAAGRALTLAGQRSVADGLAPPMTGERNLAHVQAFVDEMVTVSEDAIVDATRIIAERAKLTAEPSAAAPFAALVSGACRPAPGSRVVCVVSGGNIDLALYGRT